MPAGPALASEVRAMIRLLLASVLLVALAAGCGSSEPGEQELDVKVDTATELAWQQHLANVAFADDGYSGSEIVSFSIDSELPHFVVVEQYSTGSERFSIEEKGDPSRTACVAGR